jgi:hypothetical protein
LREGACQRDRELDRRVAPGLDGCPLTAHDILDRTTCDGTRAIAADFHHHARDHRGFGLELAGVSTVDRVAVRLIPGHELSVPYNAAMADPDLSALRDRIEQVDRQIIALLAERQQVVEEVVVAKLASASPFRDREREERNT